MEFLLLADALERLGVRHINVVIPWMGYSKQDKVFREGEPIGAKVVANLVSNAYVKRAFLLDLHNSSTPGFFSIPTMHLSANQEFVKYAKENIDLSQAIIASPDFGGLKRSRVFADQLGLDLANIDKHRDLHSGEITAVDIHGDVAGKTAIIFDDCILSGGTAIEANNILKERGAKEVILMITHGVFGGGAEERLQNSSIDSIIVTNSIEQHHPFPKLKVLDVAALFGEEIKDWI
jgi:ribose-phosphate pyrophosphokinase